MVGRAISDASYASMSSSSDFTTPRHGTASNFCLGKNSLKNSLCVLQGVSTRSFESPTAPHPYAKNRSGIWLSSALSIRMAPAAAFRAFLNTRAPVAARSALTRRKSSSATCTSPRISKTFGYGATNAAGTPRAPIKCLVTSSPTSPSPLDTAYTNFPSSYRRLADAPSTLGSAQYSAAPSPSSPRAFSTRFTNASTCPTSNALPNDRIGTSCEILRDPLAPSGVAPTRALAPRARAAAGCARSIASYLARNPSYSASSIVGIASL